MNAFHCTPRGSQPDNNPLQHKCCYKTTLFDNRGSRTVTNRRQACASEHWSWLHKNERSLVICLDWCCRLVFLPVKEMKQLIQKAGSNFHGSALRKPMEMQQCWPHLLVVVPAESGRVEQDLSVWWSGGGDFMVWGW